MEREGYSYLFRFMVKTELRIKYKDSVLGIIWSLLNPLLQMIVLTIIFSQLFERSIPNFPLYIVTGRLIFDFFSNSTNSAMSSLSRSGGIIKKMAFPKFFIPLSKVTAIFITLLISLIDLVIVILVTGHPVTFNLLYGFIYLFLLYVFSCGFSLLLSSLVVFFRDIEHLYSIFLMILMYFSAIFYPVDIIPEQFRLLLIGNPIYYFIAGFRDCVYLGVSINFENLLFCAVYALLFIILGFYTFKKKENEFIHYI